MAKALSGGVIIKESGNQYTWQYKCDKCGYLVPGTKVSFVKPKGTKTVFTHGSCPKCRSSIKIVLLDE